jgi:hypothetical protein
MIVIYHHIIIIRQYIIIIIHYHYPQLYLSPATIIASSILDISSSSTFIFILHYNDYPAAGKIIIIYSYSRIYLKQYCNVPTVLTKMLFILIGRDKLKQGVSLFSSKEVQDDDDHAAVVAAVAAVAAVAVDHAAADGDTVVRVIDDQW